MTKFSYAGYRFPPVIIQQAIWLYLSFTLSFRVVEDVLAERGIIVSYEPLAKFIERVIFLSPIGSLWSKVRRAPA
jgi:transposase-like protein